MLKNACIQILESKIVELYLFIVRSVAVTEMCSLLFSSKQHLKILSFKNLTHAKYRA